MFKTYAPGFFAAGDLCAGVNSWGPLDLDTQREKDSMLTFIPSTICDGGKKQVPTESGFGMRGKTVEGDFS